MIRAGLFLMGLLALSVPAQGQTAPTCSVELRWDAAEPAGAALVFYDLAYGSSPRLPGSSVVTYTKTVTVPATDLTVRVPFTAGKWYAAVRARDAAGRSSLFSNEVAVVCDPGTNKVIPNTLTGVTAIVRRG